MIVLVCGLAVLVRFPDRAAAEQPKTAAKAATKPASKPAHKGDAKPAAPPPPAEARSDSQSDSQSGPQSGLKPDEPAKTENTGLPIPRFVSLRTEPVNLRTGPGVRYPVEWVYRRRHLPVEIVAEFDTWRRIRDPDGSEGWVHQGMVTGRRTAIVRGGTQPLRRSNVDTADSAASLEAGVIVNIQRCPSGSLFCRVEVGGIQGWIKREQLWGVYPDEAVE